MALSKLADSQKRTSKHSKFDLQLNRQRLALIRVCFALSDEKNWSVAELASQARLCTGTIYYMWDKILEREFYEPRFSSLQKLALAVGIDICQTADGEIAITGAAESAGELATA